MRGAILWGTLVALVLVALVVLGAWALRRGQERALVAEAEKFIVRRQLDGGA